MSLHLHLVGLSHRTAPVELREKLHVPEDGVVEALRRLAGRSGVEECYILSTCNRVEVLVREAEEDRGGEQVVEFLVERGGIAAAELRPCLYHHRGFEAVRHLFRVAASLDSMIVGEPQIVHQVRAALQAARTAGTVGSVLNPALDKSLSVARRIRSETELAQHAVSISYAAVELARKIFGELDGRRAMLLGAGEMSELAAKHLLKHGVDALQVANRSPQRAERLAARFGGRVVRWDRVLDELVDSDIVLASTAAPHPVIEAPAVQRVMPLRRYRPVFFIDIAVPRDIDPAVNDIDNAYLYDVDDLEAVVEENKAVREREAGIAERMIDEEVEAFRAQVRSWSVTPTIVGLREHGEQLLEAELERHSGSLVGLTAEQRRAVEAVGRGLLQKLLHAPIEALKDDARDGDGAASVRAVQRLFDLGVAPVEPAAEDGEGAGADADREARAAVDGDGETGIEREAGGAGEEGAGAGARDGSPRAAGDDA